LYNNQLDYLDAPRISQDLSLLGDVEGINDLPQLLHVGIPTETYNVKANTSVLMGRKKNLMSV